MPVRSRNLSTQRLDALPFRRARQIVVFVGLAGAAASLAGCATASIDDAMPVSSASMLPETAPAPTEAQRGTATNPGAAEANPEIVDAPVETAAVPAEPMSSGGPKDTGTFPNLNIKPGVAAAQMTDEEKAADIQALRGIQAGHQATIATAGKDIENPALLRKLAAEHAKDALSKIEGK